jgi:hypothetical protein|tara:strand:+ start:76 stop:252 length:177 start_codon:yes stop_codon:yes gene_type:complete
MKNKLRSPKDKKFNGMSDNKNNKTTEFGMLSVKAGIDNDPNPTQADRIAGATMKKGRA